MFSRFKKLEGDSAPVAVKAQPMPAASMQGGGGNLPARTPMMASGAQRAPAAPPPAAPMAPSAAAHQAAQLAAQTPRNPAELGDRLDQILFRLHQLHAFAGDPLPELRRLAAEDRERLRGLVEAVAVKDARIAELEATEEGARVAYGHLSAQKRAAERECTHLRGLLDDAHAQIRRQAELLNSRA